MYVYIYVHVLKYVCVCETICAVCANRQAAKLDSAQLCLVSFNANMRVECVCICACVAVYVCDCPQLFLEQFMCRNIFIISCHFHLLLLLQLPAI